MIFTLLFNVTGILINPDEPPEKLTIQNTFKTHAEILAAEAERGENAAAYRDYGMSYDFL
jgi:hypothetical protein